MDWNSKYQAQYYRNIPWDTPHAATIIAVAVNHVTSNIDAILQPAVSPLATVLSSHGCRDGGSQDWAGSVTQLREQPADILVRYTVVCPSTVAPSQVVLHHMAQSFAMTAEPPGGNSYVGAIPSASRGDDADIGVEYTCGGQPTLVVVGRIQLYDPSGAVTDAGTGQAVPGAQVVLFRIPGWRPDTTAEVRECRTVNTRNGPTWENQPAAASQLGAAMNTIWMPRNQFAVNPQQTDEFGRYQGCG